jgi:thymidylate synthase (methanogen type)
VDQIVYVIQNLIEHSTTRRAVAITWSPWWDNESEHVPCLQTLVFLIRSGRLNLTAFFRSWDCKRAAPANLYGLGRLLLHVAGQVGADVGSLTVVAASGHVYEV